MHIIDIPGKFHPKVYLIKTTLQNLKNTESQNLRAIKNYQFCHFRNVNILQVYSAQCDFIKPYSKERTTGIEWSLEYIIILIVIFICIPFHDVVLSIKEDITMFY